jgi:hypothetical protein
MIGATVSSPREDARGVGRARLLPTGCDGRRAASCARRASPLARADSPRTMVKPESRMRMSSTKPPNALAATGLGVA